MTQTNERPNFVFIFPDQWRGDCLSCLKHPAVETPWLDMLAGEGVRFTNAYSPAPTCVPARACLITGQSASSCGRPGMQEGVPWQYEVTLMSTLRDHGYQTMLAGKTHFFPQMAGCGFEEMLHYEAKVVGDVPECDYHRWLAEETNGQIQDTSSIVDRNTWIAYPWPHSEHLHPNSWTTRAAIELITQRDPQRPFFIQVSYNRPHPPLDPPSHYFDMFRDREVPTPPVGSWVQDWTAGSGSCLPPPTPHQQESAQRAYYAQLAHLDHQVGQLIHYLRWHGLWENTYLIFTSDHGEMLGDHSMFAKTVPLEGSANIPFIIRAPKAIRGAQGVVCEAPLTLCDVMPTVLEEAGVPIPETVEGASLAPFVRGEQPSWREGIHGEHAGTHGWQFETDGREKFFWESRSGQEWFFDLREDPQELVNRVDDPGYAERVQHWRQRLIENLAARPEDGLSDGERLISGKVLPRTRPELLNT